MHSFGVGVSGLNLPSSSYGGTRLVVYTTNFY
jgi:hypothetical protein